MRRRVSLLLIILFVTQPLFAGTVVLTDLSAPVSLTDARVVGTGLSPGVDSTHYVRIRTVDTLMSGIASTASNGYQSAWPTLASTGKDRFRFSYIYCTIPFVPDGNHYLEKQVTLFPDQDSIYINAASTSQGALLTSRIPASSKYGGVNARSFTGPGNRVFRVCQVKGGSIDTVAVLDAPLVSNNNPFLAGLDGISGSKSYADYALNSTGDTLFTIYVKTLNSIKVNPIRILGPDSIARGTPVPLLTDATSNGCSDLALARDSATGVFLAAALRNSVSNDARLLLVRAASNFTGIDTVHADAGLYVPTLIERNIRAVSLGHSRFAVAYAKAAGPLYMKLVDVSGGTPAVTATLTLDAGSAAVPSLSCVNNRLAVAWLHRTGGAPADNGRLYGRAYDLVNGVITDTSFSGQVSASSTISEYINNIAQSNNFNTAIALDTAGSFMAAYADHDYRLYATAFMPLFYYFDSASAVIEDSLDGSVWGSFAGDSIRYTGFSFADTGNGGTSAIEFSAGSVAGFVPSFQSVSGATIVSSLSGSHYKYNVRMTSAVTGRQRPVVCSLGVVYNVKPKGAALDSFRVNGLAVSWSDDTVRLVARTDTLRIFAHARDYDGNAAMTGHFTGLGPSFDSTLRSAPAMAYAGSALVLPVDHADTVYRLAFSATDSNGWGTNTDYVYVKLHNPAPVLTASDTVFYAGGSRSGTLSGYTDTVRFMKRQNLILRFEMSDSNDAASLSGRATLNGLRLKTYDSLQQVLDTLTSAEMTSSDTQRYAFAVRDPGGLSDSISFVVIAYNPLPSDSLAGVAYTFQNDTALSGRIQSGDTVALVDSGYIVFHAFGRDSNETDLAHVLLFKGARIDSGLGALNYTDTLYADSVAALESVGMIVSDSLVADTVMFYVRVSHPPRILSLRYQNQAALFTQDSVAVNIRNGVPDTFVLSVSDTDVSNGDSLRFLVRLDGSVDTQRTTQSQTFTYYHAPSATDRRAVIRVTDLADFSDSVIVDFLYPVFTFGPTHAADSLYFTDSISRFVTRSALPRDSVSAQSHVVALSNPGTDTLRLSSVFLKSGRASDGWLRFGWASDASGTGAVLSGSLSSTKLLLPSDTAFLVVRDSAAVPFGATSRGLRTLASGDTVIYDTIGLVTNDPLHDTVWMPVRIVCNELPYAVGDSLLFLGNVPLLPKTRAASAGVPYVPSKPGYRSLALVFNEFIDTLSVTGQNFLVYSAFDSALFAASVGADSFRPIPGSVRWGARTPDRQDTLFFTPAYTTGGYTSPAFANAQPPDGYFVAADLLRVRVSRNVLDLAGNGFDVAASARPDPARLYRIYGAALDSGSLRVIALSPDMGETNVTPHPVLRITFSASLDSASVDTARTGNRSVRVVASFNPLLALSLASSPAVSGAVLTVVPEGPFYSGDSVRVTLSASLRDTFHSTLDGNQDGRGAFFYRFGASTYAQVSTFTTDPDTSADNYSFWFRMAVDAFYFYPCPFEPARNARHEALGGVVFKNLHALEKNQTVDALNMRIYNVAGDLVYSTRQKNAPIRFESGSGNRPEWRWDTRNNSGRAVGSGLYLFSFTDSNDKKVIKQGKLIVIR